MVTNRVGQPVRGDDFFGRELEQSHCWEILEAGHLLLLAPRGMGKTSLMLKLAEDARAHGFEASSMGGSEAAFVQRLSEAAEAIGQQDGRRLLLIDELPVFVLSLLRQDPSGERARRFLTWFRELRQRADGRLRWLLAGSVGLDTLAARLDVADTLDDLRIFRLGPFSREEADAFLRELAASHDLPLSAEVRGHILRRVGWTIPYHLQLVFSRLLARCKGGWPVIDHVERVFEDLLSPASKVDFDHWRQRLTGELGKADAGYALALLDTIAVEEAGAFRPVLLQALGRRVRVEQREEKLRYLLGVLESDGYIVAARESGPFQFRSPFLRELWVRRMEAEEKPGASDSTPPE